jgi:predicted transcriptional regulator
MINKENLKDNIEKLIEIENEEQKIKKYMNSLKEKKENLNDSIISYIEENNYQSKDIILGDKKIKYAIMKNQDSITKKLILERLTSFLKSAEIAQNATQFIYSERNTTQKSILKIMDLKIKSDK